MKKLSKRILSLALVLTLILSLSALLSGCYLINSGKMSAIEGTYELTSYSGKSNYMEERGIKMYLVISSSGTGYFAYQSNTEAPYITELRCRFTQDTEKPGSYSYVEIDFEGNGNYVNFGINSTMSSTSISSSRAVWGGNLLDGTLKIEYYVTSSFKRVSKTTDLSYLKGAFGDTPTLPFGSIGYQGVYEGYGLIATDKSPDSASIPEDPFVYCFARIDLINGKGKMWYMLKSDETAKVVEFDATISSDLSSIMLGETSARLEKISSSGYMYVPIITDEGEFAIYFANNGDYSDEEMAQTVTDIYNNYLASKPVE